MTQGAAAASDKVTILVFKDNYAARTFQIPLQWISRIGIFLTFLVSTAGISTFYALKYHHIASKNDPSRVLELEQELTDLKTNLKSLETKTTESLTRATQIPATPATSPTSGPDTTDHKNHSIPLPLITQSVASFNFVALPTSAQTQTPDSTSIPIEIQAAKVNWQGSLLKVRFALQYTKTDRGNQEGRILILARGPEALLSYPAGTVNKTGSENLLAPENGEFFSVSRYREVRADFGPVRSQESIKEIEIFLFNSENQVITYEKLPVQAKTETEESSSE